MESLLSLQFDEQSVFLFLIMLASILAFFLLFIGIASLRSPLKAKLLEIKRSSAGENLKKAGRLDSTLESLAPKVQSDSKESQSLRLQLMHAGYRDSNALTVFYVLKTLSILIGVGGAVAMYFIVPDMPNLTIVMILSAGGGLYLPNVALSRLVSKRQSRIRGGVPDALDLLVVCTESGLGFNAALRRVADELMLSHPDFAEELDTVCVKIKAGFEMSDAFEELIDRTGVRELNGLVTMLAHASRIGGSLSQTLRDYTEDFRDKRTQELEEIAAKVPTKMIFPLLIFIWPCFFIVAVGPSLIFLSDTLGS